MSEGLLFVDDEREKVELAAEILAESLDTEVMVVDSVEQAIGLLQERPWRAVVLDLFIPLGEHAERTLGPRARKFQENVEHLGGLLLLDELDRLADPPVVISHTACTDPVLHELFEGRVARMIPKPAPLEVLLAALMEELAL
ncbi:MAG: hypothetical protein AAF211_13040 [Myxococcota bacterium]